MAELLFAYSVFASVPKPRILHGSPLRDVDSILRDITSAPLRRLTADQLGDFATFAITTVGEVEHYRHFLPRILELSFGSGLDMGFEGWVIAGKLEMAGWRTWPSDERQAIEAVFRAAFRRAIEMDTDEERRADDWLCGLRGFSNAHRARLRRRSVLRGDRHREPRKDRRGRRCDPRLRKGPPARRPQLTRGPPTRGGRRPRRRQLQAG
jgi:hypothetical protein